MCTTLQLKAKDGAVIVGRTMEFGIDPKSHLMIVPPGTKMTGTLPVEKKGIEATTKYGMIGATALGLSVIVDGINDQGLYVGDLYFPGFAKYAEITGENASRSMASFEFGQWLLGNFASVADIKANMGEVFLAAATVKDLSDGVPPLHFTTHDKTGAALVIEPLAGRLVLSDNPVGVLTNAPAFDWHLTNLRNYTGLNAINKRSALLGDYTNEPLEFGNGTGMFGLPGDSSPTARFIRAVAYSQAALPVAAAKEAVHQANQIMNNFDIAPGSVRDENGKQMHADTTAWTVVVDLKNGLWTYRTFKSQNYNRLMWQTASELQRGLFGPSTWSRRNMSKICPGLRNKATNARSTPVHSRSVQVGHCVTGPTPQASSRNTCMTLHRLLLL